MNHQYENEEDVIEEAWQEGRMSDKERDDELRELQRDYRAAAEEAAEGAYHRELESW